MPTFGLGPDIQDTSSSFEVHQLKVEMLTAGLWTHPWQVQILITEA